jgi:Tfp pilus assembly protein PilO
VSKLTRLHVVIIFLVVYVIVGVGLFWFMIKPKKAELASAQAAYQQRKQVADMLPQRQQDLAAAQRAKAETELKHSAYVRKYMPSNIRDLSPINQRRYLRAYWEEVVNGTGRVLTAFARSQPVSVTSAFQVPAAPTDPQQLPMDAIATPIKWQFQGVTCFGSYQNILKYLRAWVNCPRLVRIDSLRLEGESPYLTCVTDLTVFIFLRKAGSNETEVRVEPYLTEGGGAGGRGFGGGIGPGPAGPAGGPVSPAGPSGAAGGMAR